MKESTETPTLNQRVQGSSPCAPTKSIRSFTFGPAAIAAATPALLLGSLPQQRALAARAVWQTAQIDDEIGKPRSSVHPVPCPATRLFGTLGHPVENVGEIKQLLLCFRDRRVPS